MRSSIGVSFILGGSLSLLGMSFMPACSGSTPQNFTGTNTGSSGGSSSGGSGSGSSSGSDSGIPNFGGSSGGGSGSSSGSSSGGIVCPAGLQCNVSCTGSASTTITGTVLDPAGVNPLYNIVAYVPSTTVGALPSGVPTGAAACSCSALFTGDPIVYTTTDTSGNFTITNAPVGDVPVVIQVGKWRKQIKVTTTACTATSAGKINLPKNSTEGDIPDIAVSTGYADSLECLLRRIGLDASEYVPGWTQPGHVHIFNGGVAGASANGAGPEKNQMVGAPNSYATGGLWDTAADLMKNDIVLLSCEGSETANAIPANLETYLNAGGRAFASHYHYAWFTGTGAPADWGNNLAAWSTLPNLSGASTATVGGNVVTTLTTGGGSFPKGQALQTWLTNVKALTTTIGGMTVANPELPVAEPRYNALVTNQSPSQSWIQLDTSTDPTDVNILTGMAEPQTLYFSFDTPVGEAASPDGAPPTYCGRAVFSGLHVGGASYDGVNCGGSTNVAGVCNAGAIAAAPPPAGCDTGHPLSPQEQALEFMLFDLSSCVVPDTIAPTTDAGTPYFPK